MEVLPYGPTACLVQDPPGGPAAFRRGVLDAGLPISTCVPAERTVLLTVNDPSALPVVISALDAVTPITAQTDTRLVEIPVRYTGQDIDTVAQHLGGCTTDVVSLHCDRLYTASFVGFSPGFAYLTGLDPRLVIERRAQPRPRIAAGSVALGATYTAVYPRQSPGGWQIIGFTALEMFSATSQRPSLITPGDQVRFVEVTR